LLPAELCQPPPSSTALEHRSAVAFAGSAGGPSCEGSVAGRR